MVEKTYRDQPKLTSIAESIKGKKAKERAVEKVKAYQSVNTPIEYQYDGLRIVIERIGKEGDLLKVFASATKDSSAVTLNNPYLFKNPPVLVPDGTWHKEKRKVGKKEVETDMPNWKCHLKECLKEILGQVISQQINK